MCCYHIYSSYIYTCMHELRPVEMNLPLSNFSSLLSNSDYFLAFLVLSILYNFWLESIILCAETEQGVAEAIIRSVVNFKKDPWPLVSDNAKDLVKKMLNPDPKQRLTAQEVLGNVQFCRRLSLLFIIIKRLLLLEEFGKCKT